MSNARRMLSIAFIELGRWIEAVLLPTSPLFIASFTVLSPDMSVVLLMPLETTT